MLRLNSYHRTKETLKASSLVLGLASALACDATLGSPADGAQGTEPTESPDAGPGKDSDEALLVDGEDYEPQCDTSVHANLALRLLTPSQYAHAITTTFAPLALDRTEIEQSLPSPSAAAGYASNAEKAVGDTELEALLKVSKTVTDAVISGFDKLMDCKIDAPCADDFISVYGERLFRGAVPEAERSGLMALYQNAASPSQGLEQLVMGLLLSAPVLYQAEDHAEERRPLSGRELASKMSLLLWDSIPDEELLTAAENGELEHEEGLLQQSQRMLEDPRAKRMLRSFYAQWLGLVALHAGETTTLDASGINSLQNESLRFAEHFTLERGGSYSDLLFSRVGFPDEMVAALYGTEPSVDGQSVELPKERAGLLTRAGFLAASSHLTETAPTIRGAQIRERFLCQVVPSPPASVQDMFPELPSDPNLSKRQKLELHQAPGCTGCHVLLDPIGFSFEAYDEHGRYRTEYEGGEPIDASGEVTPIGKSASEIQGKFDGPAGLAELISTSRTGRDCFAAQWFQFALQRRVEEVDACAFEQLRAGFHNNDYSLTALIESIVLNPAFRFRNAEE